MSGDVGEDELAGFNGRNDSLRCVTTGSATAQGGVLRSFDARHASDQEGGDLDESTPCISEEVERTPRHARILPRFLEAI